MLNNLAQKIQKKNPKNDMTKVLAIPKSELLYITSDRRCKNFFSICLYRQEKREYSKANPLLQDAIIELIMKRIEHFTKERLDQFTLDIEFLLISVVQGLALATLAASAHGPFSHMEFFAFPYILSGFVLILNFWAAAIIHAISFIDWPLDLSHSFLYFLAGFIEVMAFSNINDPLRWFGFVSVFLIVAAILYIVDFSMIKNRKNRFAETPSQKNMYQHIVKRQLFELKVYVPLALFFNIGSFLAIYLFPDIFLKNQMHVILISLQAIFGTLVLLDTVKSFKTRSKFISDHLTKK